MSAPSPVVVIGGGVAGVAAGLALAAADARVTLIRSTPGATALAAGGWRGPLPDLLARALADAGLPHVPVARGLPHPSGDLYFSDFAPEAHAVTLAEDHLVVGVAGLPGFHAAGLAALWGAAAGVRLGSAVVDAGSATPSAGWSALSLAAYLERAPEALIGPLAVAVRSHGAAAVLLPAVLGRLPGNAVRMRVAEAVGVRVLEALGTPPSLPGWRLDAALLGALRASGVELIGGRVVGREVAGRRIVALHVQRGGDRTRRDCAAVVLASGKFLAGGITADPELREPAVGCPVWLEHLGQSYEAAEPLVLTRPERTEEQLLLQAGVRVDEENRALDRKGRSLYENVFVAGSVAHGTTATDGLGLAASAGIAAAVGAAREVGVREPSA